MYSFSESVKRFWATKDPNAILDDRKLNSKIGRWFTEQRASAARKKKEDSKPAGKEPGKESVKEPTCETGTETGNGASFCIPHNSHHVLKLSAFIMIPQHSFCTIFPPNPITFILNCNYSNLFYIQFNFIASAEDSPFYVHTMYDQC